MTPASERVASRLDLPWTRITWIALVVVSPWPANMILVGVLAFLLSLPLIMWLVRL